MYKSCDGKDFVDLVERNLYNAMLELYWKKTPEEGKGVLVDAKAWSKFVTSFESLYDIKEIPEHLK